MARLVRNPSIDAGARRLVAHYHGATEAELREGFNWYPSARRAAACIAYAYGVTVGQAAGIIASASLNQTWKGNLTLARCICRTREPRGLDTVVDETRDILAGDDAKAVLLRYVRQPKRFNFYLNIMGNRDAVTVDRWAARAAHPDGERLRQRVDGYNIIAAMYRRAAEQLNIPPRELQAVVWVKVRGSAA